MAAHSVFNLAPATSLLRSNPSQRPCQPSSVPILHSSFLSSETLSICSSNSNPSWQLTRRRPLSATVTLSLPTANPDRAVSVSPDKIPKWSRRTIKSFAMAELEARKLKYPTTGTESLLMGLLIEGKFNLHTLHLHDAGTSSAAKFLLANGITLFKVREESIKLLGKGDMYFFSPEHPPLTEDAQRALDWAFDEKLKSGRKLISQYMELLFVVEVIIYLTFDSAASEGGEITTSHLLLGVWSQAESPGHKILSALGFNDDKAKELGSMIQEPGYHG
ncbi:hypothetical protein CDL15_Pgr003827 [Punica granatum]|uniref:Clp R domain-containing protein n=2 Tax=Punica granatum TaxID=22663 RepID=A0A218XTC7_PUNGR|nr:hypothetical protein CDL15_Pgr003827 [Punica granatum]